MATKPSETELRAAFDAAGPMTIGFEEELMLLHPATLDLLPRGSDVLARADDGRIKPELPAAQLEIAAMPALTVDKAALGLHDGRVALARAADGIGVLAGAGAHPFAAGEGALTRSARYDRTAAEYGAVARRQLVFGLHVHVAVRGADRALAVYNELRSFLPEIAALAANSPYYEGCDTGLASVRSKLCDLLPRQGVPPAIPSWEALADAFAWGRTSGRFPEPAQWWWEARLHPLHGTVEVRAPDTQASVGDTAAIAAFVHALVAWLAARYDAGESFGRPAPTWRIAENRWTACRYGVDGILVDLETGEQLLARDRLAALFDDVAPVAAELGCAAELEAARALAERNGAIAQRELGDPRAATAWLAERFLAPP